MQIYNGVEANPNLYVHNVPKDSNEEELRHLFGQFGTVERVRLKVNQKVGPHAVYAFVTFSTTADAQRALNKLQGMDVRGRALRIEFQRTSNHATGSSSSGGTSAPYSSFVASHWQHGDEHSTTASSPEPHTPHSVLNTGTLRSVPSRAFTSPAAAETASPIYPNNHYSTVHASVEDSASRNALAPTADHMWSTGPPATVSPQDAAYGWHRDTQALEQMMPPHKRGRYHSPNSRATTRPRSPLRSATVLSPDAPQTSQSDVMVLLGQLKEIVSRTHPQALGLVDTLSDMLCSTTTSEASKPSNMLPNVVHPASSGGANRWPYFELRASQRGMLRDGALTVNPETNRYMVRLSPLLTPLKPAMFSRRPSATAAPPSRSATVPPVAAPTPPSPMQQYIAPPVMSHLTQPSKPTVSDPPPVSLQLSPTPPVSTQPQPASSDEAAWIAQISALPITPSLARSTVWQGTLARNEKKKMPIGIKRLAGYIDHYLPASMSVLNISHRSALEEMWKKRIGAIGIIEADSPEVSRAFQEYVTYFKDKNRAGVARLERPDYQMMYLLPVGLAALGETLTSNLPSGDVLLAIVGKASTARSDPPTPETTEQVHGDEEGMKQITDAPVLSTEVTQMLASTQSAEKVISSEDHLANDKVESAEKL